jgi:hypothetical protein
MLHKCANAACATLFRSMHQGKLFQIEREPERTTAGTMRTQRQTRARKRVEHYWLCDECFPLVTLTVQSIRGVVAVPLVQVNVPLSANARVASDSVSPAVARIPFATMKKPMHSVRVGVLPAAIIRSAKGSRPAGAM